MYLLSSTCYVYFECGESVWPSDQGHWLWLQA
jgi:hypothetical protein